MAKILNVTINNDNSPYKYFCSVLIFGKTWDFGASSLDKIVQKIRQRDSFTSEEDLKFDMEQCLRENSQETT